MTPEEARDLEPGTTPGPWEVERYDGFGAPITNSIGPIMSACNCDGLYVEDADANLAAAAPDMRATIAALRWGYAVEVRPDEDSEWQHAGPWWDTIEKARAWRGTAVIRIGHPHARDRLVRRPVGPVEVVE